MYITIIILPLMGAICSGLFGFLIGRKGSMILTTSFVFISFIFSCFAFYEVGLGYQEIYYRWFSWIVSGDLFIQWGFLFDSLSVTMLIVVTSVSSLVHLYSCGYMSEDPHLQRFMSYLSLFTFFMIMLVTSNNYVQLFLGWEGVGICSYLLISFWYTRIQANKAAIKAVMVNRIGDFALLVGMAVIFYIFRTLNYDIIFLTAPLYYEHTFIFCNFEFDILSVICFFLFIGAVGKSAQLGLHTWLPDAMEGPTPVSALIHAATMVTAGVFLIIRSSFLFEYAPTILILVTIVGALTAFFAATTGLVQHDLKKVIAYSTCSQLGYMVFACGLSNYTVSLFHLANHAFFKALLFLSAGAVIHALSDEQDMRRMGGLVKLLPFTYSMMLIGSLSLMGFPFLTGFYSKDVILEVALMSSLSYSVHGTFAYWLGTISAFFTAFYSWRLLYLTFLAPTNAHQKVIIGVHESPMNMLIPLGFLAFGSIFFGYLTKDLFIGIESYFFKQTIFINKNHYNNLAAVGAEFIDSAFLKLIPVIFSLVGASSAFIFYKSYNLSLNFMQKFLSSVFLINIYNFLIKKWYFDLIYNYYIAEKVLKVAYDGTYVMLDKGAIEALGPEGSTNKLTWLSKRLSRFHDGFIFTSAFIMLLGFFFVILYYDCTSGYIFKLIINDTTRFI